MDIDFDNDTWKVIYNYFDSHSNYLVKHHLDSYDDFIFNKIPQTFAQYNPQILYKEFDDKNNNYKYQTNIYYGGKDGTQIFIGRPTIYKEFDDVTKSQMYPNEARLRNLSYSSHIFCDITIEYLIRNGDEVNKFVKV